MAEAEGGESRSPTETQNTPTACLAKSGLNANGELGCSTVEAQPRRLHKPQPPPISCPECGSTRLYKDGLRYLKDGSTVQRYLCRNCGFRFSDPQRPKQPLQKTSWQSLNNGFAYTFNRQACDETQGRRALAARKGLAVLAAVDPQMEGPMREGTAATQTANMGKILEYAWWMKKQNYSNVTIRVNVSTLRTLVSRGANLDDPESVKTVLAKQNWSESRRHGAIAAYNLYVKMHGLRWEPPFCRVTRKLPFIPTEQELDALIASCGSKTSAFLQLLKETAMRCGEAIRLKWTDIDFERRIVTLNAPEKGCNPRVWKVSQKLIDMLNRLPKKNEYVFGGATVASLKSSFWHSRKRSAFKLQNPRLNRIGFHTFRHWKATTLYHQTKDPLFVKEFLGHKKLDSTLLYIQLEQALYKEDSSEFHVAIAKTPDEIKALLEVGFEYVCQKDDILYFRKRK